MFSKIEVKPVKDSSGSIKARGRVTVADVMNVNFTVCKGPSGLFVGLPSHQDSKDKKKYWPDVFIEDKKVYAELTKKVLEVYNAQVGGKSLDQTPVAEDMDQDNSNNSIPF